MGKIAYVLAKYASVPITVTAMSFAAVASAWFVNKPEVPAELRKKA